MTSQRTELIRFCLVGAGGYAVNTAAFAGSIALGGQELTAATTAFAAAVAVNFWCNRRWTFHATDDSAGRQALRFFAVSIAAFLVGAAVLQLLIDLGHLPSLPAQGASIALATPVNFLGNKAWAFADQAPLARPLAAETAPSTWLVLPTYNEAENLEPFVRSVLPQLAQATSEHHLLIVDDSSPDGTGEIADRLAAELDRVHVLHRAEKDGLGRAYVAGFRRALDEGAQLVLQMDADFSHDPASVPELIAAARDADLVLGSRYVAGGGTVGLGPRAAPAQPRRLLVRPHRARRAGARPHRRLQVLAARAARAARRGRARHRRLRLPDRDDLPRAARPARGCARCRSASATARRAARR